MNPSLYYILKPLIPRWLQILIRRRYALLRRPLYRNIWPIDPSAGKAPENWTGWPEGKRFALVLTHDVESQKGASRIPELIAIEKKFDLRSAFNFVGADYDIPKKTFQKLRESGFEIGVHGLHHTGNPFSSFEEFSKQAAAINPILKKWNALGFRSPCMYHNLAWIHQLNIEYDASTFDTDPFEPQPDGAGTIFPFTITNAQGSSYIELPYTVPQDFTVFIMMGERNIDIWKRKVDWIAEHGGMILTSTHPDYMNFGNSKPEPDEYSHQHYRDLLSYVVETYKDQYWHALPRDVARFWRSNRQDKQIAV